MKQLNISTNNSQYSEFPITITLTLAEGAGKVTPISISNAEGGTNRSPFLTAPFTKIVRAFGVDKILQPN